jgi:hypothetical protein
VKRQVGEHWVCATCDAVVPSERCPAQGHWIELRIGSRAHRVSRCSGDCLADKIGFAGARNATMRYSIGLWTEQDLLDRMAELKARLDAAEQMKEV